MLSIGKDKAWLREKLVEGMGWRLIVLPQADCAVANWAGVFRMIEAAYPEVAHKLLKWRDAVQDPALVTEIEPSLVQSAVKDHVAHPNHMSVERYSTCGDTPANARLFLWHSLGLNQHFKGDGWATDPISVDRTEEYLTENLPLAQIAGHRVITLDVRA